MPNELERMTIRSLIIDDDPFIQELLKDKLEQHFPEVMVVATGGSGTAGKKLIASHKPDLIFLDVEMGDMTGFEMLNQLSIISFQTIFITSFNHYAIKAIRFNALDYLLKPIDLGELRLAIKRYRERIISNTSAAAMENALKNFRTTNTGEKVLLLPMQDGEVKCMLKDIVRIEGERNYSYIHKSNGKRILSSKTLSNFEDILIDVGFFRCHKSHVVNGTHISAITPTHEIVLSDNSKIPISRRRVTEFKEWYSNSR